MEISVNYSQKYMNQLCRGAMRRVCLALRVAKTMFCFYPNRFLISLVTDAVQFVFFGYMS